MKYALISFGHTHKPWTCEVHGDRFVNTGSVGRPKEGDRRAGYVFVEAGEEIGTVEFVREGELPDEFAEQLSAGVTPKPVRVS